MEKGNKACEEITNINYAPKFAEYITLEFMPYIYICMISICGALMLDHIDQNLSRVSNAYVESHNKTLKVNILEGQKRNTLGTIVRKLEENMKALIEEESLNIPIPKKRIHKPMYPDAASNILIEDVWKRGQTRYK